MTFNKYVWRESRFLSQKIKWFATDFGPKFSVHDFGPGLSDVAIFQGLTQVLDGQVGPDNPFWISSICVNVVFRISLSSQYLLTTIRIRSNRLTEKWVTHSLRQFDWLARYGPIFKVELIESKFKQIAKLVVFFLNKWKKYQNTLQNESDLKNKSQRKSYRRKMETILRDLSSYGITEWAEETWKSNLRKCSSIFEEPWKYTIYTKTVGITDWVSRDRRSNGRNWIKM